MTTEVKNLLFQDKSPKLSFYIKYIRAVDLHMQKERDEYMKEVSKDRKKYLRKIRLRKIEILITQIAINTKVEVVSESNGWSKVKVNGKEGYIAVKTFMNLSSNNLIEHLKITVEETLIGFLLGTIAGAITAIILWWSPFISKVSEPFLVVLNSLPKIALGPVIIIWVGAGMPAIIVMALSISLIVTILEILNGFLHTDKEKIKMAKTFNANKIQILNKIVIPSNIPTFFNTLKVNIGLSLVGVISGEFLVSKGGLGYLIVYGGQVFQLDLVMTSVIILAVVAALMYESIVVLEKIFVK